MACDSATVHRPKVPFPKKTWAFFQAAEAVSAGLILARWSRGSDRRRADRPKILACGSLATTDGSARHRGSQPNPQYDGRPKGRHSLMSRSLLLGLVAIVGAIGPSKSLASSGEAIPKSVLPRSRRLPKARPQAQRIALGDAALRLFVLTCVCASIA
jgi:hypothetical protein